MDAVRGTRWWGERASPVAVTVLAVAWAVAILAFPGFIQWLRVDADQKSISEGPCEWAEDVVLLSCLVLWAAVTWWSRRDSLRLGVAVAMTLQLVVVLGEELDWGRELGMRGFVGERNFRRIALTELGVSESVGAVVLMSILGLFFAWPLVPSARAARWLARIAPLHAEPADGLALFALPLLCLMMARVGAPPSVEFVQLAGYVVLALVSIRVAAAVRRTRAG